MEVIAKVNGFECKKQLITKMNQVLREVLASLMGGILLLNVVVDSNTAVKVM